MLFATLLSTSLVTGRASVGSASGSARSAPSIATAVSSPSSPGIELLAPAREAAQSCGEGQTALSFLEHNAWLMTFGGTTILVDPLLEGPLDFGLPAALYSATKRKLPTYGLAAALPQIDAIVITQGLADHAHEPTLRSLASNGVTCPIVAPPSASSTLKAAGFSETNIHLIEHGQTFLVGGVEVVATSGALVGPPWQARENGYIFRPKTGTPYFPSVYIEPHAEFNAEELRKLAPVDAVITPVVGQFLPAFELVHGGAAALALCETLRPRTVLPMGNGEINASGLTASLVRAVGSVAEFGTMLAKSAMDANLETVKPGQPVWLSSA